MSHFTVLVVGENAEDQLQPFHEFECTGTDDQYVVDVDVTEEARAEFERRTCIRLRGPDGALHDFFDETGSWRPEFSRPVPEPFGLERREGFVPDGYSEVEVPLRDAESFAEFVKGEYGVSSTSAPDTAGEHKYGYALVDADGGIVKVIDRTNPNAKWDWYELGGRWTGFFKIRGGAASAVGRPGLMTTAARPGFADSVRRGDIDFDGTEAAEVEKMLPDFDRALAIVTEHGVPPTWASVRDSVSDIELARFIYNRHPAVIALNAARLMPFSSELLDRFCGFDRAAFIAMTRARAWSPYALLINGTWIGRGEMGWFGMSHGDVPEKEWHAKVRETVLALPPDTLLSVYDCHI